MTIKNCTTCQVSEDNLYLECRKCTGPDWPNWKGKEVEPAQRTAADPNVESVRAMLSDRAAAGLLKYGTDTTRTDLTRAQWLRHAQEEALDLAVYLERLIADDEQAKKKQ